MLYPLRCRGTLCTTWRSCGGGEGVVVGLYPAHSMCFSSLHTPLWCTVHPTDPGYRCVNPCVKLSPRTCPLQFFADFRSTTETPLVGCRSNQALSPVTCCMLWRRVPPELCVSCAVVEVWRRLDLSPRGGSLFTRAPDSCRVVRRCPGQPGSPGSCPPALPNSRCPTSCRSSEGTQEREGCAFNGSVRASQM